MRKQLTTSARDAELLRQQLIDGKNRSERDLADQQLQEELILLRETLHKREVEIEKLQSELLSEHSIDEFQTLKETIEDLEIVLREKERIIDSHDDEKVILLYCIFL